MIYPDEYNNYQPDDYSNQDSHNHQDYTNPWDSDSDLNSDYNNHHSNSWDSPLANNYDSQYENSQPNNHDSNYDYSSNHSYSYNDINHAPTHSWEMKFESNSYQPHKSDNFNPTHPWEMKVESNSYQSPHLESFNSNQHLAVYHDDSNSSHILTPDSQRSIDFNNNNTVYFHKNYGYQTIGYIKGNYFYDSRDNLLGHLGSDLKIYDAHNIARGYVTPNGRAYDNAGHLFAKGGPTKWAAATYVYNNFSAS